MHTTENESGTHSKVFDQFDYLASVLDQINDRIENDESIATAPRKRVSTAELRQMLAPTLAAIVADNQNQMRCVLTGQPYGTVNDSAIESFLLAQAMTGGALDEEHLRDAWDLTLFSMSSRVGPALHNRNRFSLVSLLDGTESGYASAITFYLTRFFFGFDPFNRGMTSARSVARMHFAADWYDLLITLPVAQLTTLTYRLSTSDDWFPLGQWKKLGLFSPRSTSNGIASGKHTALRNWTLVPESFEADPISLQTALNSMLDLIIKTNENEAPLKVSTFASESRLVMDEVTLAIENEVRTLPTVHDPVNVAYAEYLQFLTAVGNRTSGMKWSATHGRGYLPGGAGPVKPPKKEKAKADSAPKLGGRGRASKAGASARAAMLEAFTGTNFNGFEL